MAFLKDFFVGTSPTTQIIKPEDKIAKADPTESALYSGLGGLSQGSLDYADYIAGDRQGLYDQTMQGLQDYSTQLGDFQYTGELNQPMSDRLTQMYENQLADIDAYSDTGVGGALNEMALRGIINSSATGKAFGDIAGQANLQKSQAQSNLMNQMMTAYDRQYGADWNKLQAQGQAVTNPYGFMESAYQSAYQEPKDMWSQIRGDRYGLEQDVIQTPGSSGFLQNVAGGVGTGAGIVAGGAMFSDERLKTNIVKVKEADGTDCKIDGHQIYTWDWNDKGQELVEQLQGMGVIAQEVPETRPDAIIHDEDYLMVDYGLLFGEE